MVSNVGTLPGIVSLDARSEENNTLIITFNSDAITIDEIIARIKQTGDQVSGWEMQ